MGWVGRFEVLTSYILGGCCLYIPRTTSKLTDKTILARMDLRTRMVDVEFWAEERHFDVTSGDFISNVMEWDGWDGV